MNWPCWLYVNCWPCTVQVKKGQWKYTKSCCAWGHLVDEQNKFTRRRSTSVTRIRMWIVPSASSFFVWMDGTNFVPYVLFVYGYPVFVVRKCLLILSRILHLCILAIFIYRLQNTHLFFPKKSIIKVAAHVTEMLHVLVHLTTLWYLKKMQRHFSYINFGNSNMKRALRTVDFLFLVTFSSLFAACSIILYSAPLPFDENLKDGTKFAAVTAAYSLTGTFHIPYCFLFVAAVVIYHFGQMNRLNQMKICFRYNDWIKGIQLINEFERVHEEFESSFSFIPFGLLVLSWFGGLVYTIGGAFNNRAGKWFDWFSPLLSIYLQLCVFVTVIFAVSINHLLSRELNRLISQLECETGEIKILHLTSRFRLLCSKTFTAWNVFELKYTFIYPYVSSLVSFSLLFLQLELRYPQKAWNKMLCLFQERSVELEQIWTLLYLACLTRFTRL